MELELVSLVSDGKVALGDPVPASLEGHLVASQPALVAYYSCAMDSCTIDVIVDVTAKVDVVTFVPCLDFATLFAARMMRRQVVNVRSQKHHTAVTLIKKISL